MKPLVLSLARLAAFGDRTWLRDPRARAASPSLLVRNGAREPELEVRGPFQLRRAVTVTKDRGKAFVAATGDPNPIHIDGDVIPGAFTAAEMIAPLEVLLPRLELDTLRVSFTGVAWYGRALRTVVTLTPHDSAGVTIVAQAFQGDRLVATGEAEGRIRETTPRIELARNKRDPFWLARVESFFRALGIDPAAYLEKPEGQDASYPYAFLAALPSGTMVQRLSGQGGILNRLTLEFEPDKLPIAGPPEVSLELPARLRSSFNKVITKIKEGVLTAARGAALVLPRSSAPADFLRDDHTPTPTA